MVAVKYFDTVSGTWSNEASSTTAVCNSFNTAPAASTPTNLFFF